MILLQKLHLLTIILLPSFSYQWNLSNYNLLPHYFSGQIAIFRHRIFLSLPRSSCFNSKTSPTLLELPSLRNDSPPKRLFFGDTKQTWGDCRELQDVISIATDSKHGRLWVLDRGNGVCEGKILVYNLFTNHLVATSRLKGLVESEVESLVLDVEVNLGFIGGNVGVLGVYSLEDFKWWRVRFQEGEEVGTQQMAVMRSRGLIFLSGGGDELFSVDLAQIRRLKSTAAKRSADVVFVGLNATFVGHKLGPSTAITTDNKNSLIYFLKRDYAVVKWNVLNPLLAEFHEVLAQSYEIFPYVSSFFTGPLNIWALVNPFGPSSCNEYNETNFESVSKLPPRLTKVYRHS